jgi:Predicted ATPase (AAA+ superfamily)
LLTGSSSLRFAKMVKDSLAGRLATIRLRTLALGELKGGSGNFLKRAFLRDFTGGFDQLDKRMVIHLAFQGGYPETLDFSPKARKGWYRDYVDDLLMKDIRDVTEIRKTEALLKVVDWMLAYTAKIFDRKTLCTAAQLSGVTIDNYLGALGALYLFDAVPAWAGSDYAKIGKRVKYFAADPGLVANQLGWKEEQVYLDGDRSGKLVETWVYHELAAISGLNQEYTITQYRDSDKHEIDFIVENDDGDLLGIEVKAGSNLGPEDFKHLKWFSAKMSKSRFTGIVLYTGKDVLRFGEGFYAVPMAMLAV